MGDEPDAVLVEEDAGDANTEDPAGPNGMRRRRAPLPVGLLQIDSKGAYPVVECDDPELILVATGSEVSLCVDAAKEMSGKKVRVVSMPSAEIFRSQPESYKQALLPKKVPKMSVETAVTTGWGEFTDAHVGINTFGASAPGDTCLDKFGFNVPNVVKCAEQCLKGETGVLSDGSQAAH